MLNFFTPKRSRKCNGLSRRSFLQVGTVSMLGLSLAEALESRAAATGRSAAPMNCILLWLDGGISTIDTLDMKPQAPVEYRGEFKPISSSLPGVSICEHLPKLSQQLHRIGQIRTVEHSGSQHAEACHFMLSGWPQVPDVLAQPVGSVVHPCYGSVVSEQLGWNQGLPPFVQLSAGNIKYHHAGFLGSAYDALKIKNDPNSAEFSVNDVSVPSSIGLERMDRRRRLLSEVDNLQRVTDRAAGAVFDRNQFYDQAYDLITSTAAKRAFKLEQEPDKLRDQYGRCREGQATLLARRLVEAGVRFVTVEFNGYDTHDKNFVELRDLLLPKLDTAYSALLEDLDQRGLLDNTLVVCMGEFGRTPKVNGAAGRDHYPKVNSICLSGAGVSMGSVVGQTSDRCEQVVGAANSTHDLAATFYRLLGVDHLKEYRTLDNRPILTTDNGRAIRGILA